MNLFLLKGLLFSLFGPTKNEKITYIYVCVCVCVCFCVRLNMMCVCVYVLEKNGNKLDNMSILKSIKNKQDIKRKNVFIKWDARVFVSILKQSSQWWYDAILSHPKNYFQNEFLFFNNILDQTILHNNIALKIA